MRISKLQGLLDEIAQDAGKETEVHEIDIHNNGHAASVYYGDGLCLMMAEAVKNPPDRKAPTTKGN